MNCNKCALLFM